VSMPVGLAPTDEQSAGERWRAIPRGWRIVLFMVAVIVAAELGLSVVDGIVGSAPAGNQASSSYGTTSGGLGALSQLLSARGHPVVRLTTPVSSTHLPAGATLFIVDPAGWTSGDSAAVASYINRGGHVVLAGQPPSTALLRAMFATTAPTWQPVSGSTAHPVGSSGLVAGISSVTAGPQGSLRSVRSVHVILTGNGRVFGVAGGPAGISAPQSVLVASSTFLTNAWLDQADNAAFALNLAGPSNRAVVFDEYAHGYGRTGTGLSGLPLWWRTGLALALAAILAWMLSAARRFGPVQKPERDLIPARVEYADAMATALATLPADRLNETMAPLRHEARRLLCRRAGVWTSADDAAVHEAARAAAVPEEVVAVVLAPGGTPPDPIGLGSAVAWLETHTESRR
jgi:Domain of unknown function (DUF4350)